MRSLFASVLFLSAITACTDTPPEGEQGGAADIQGEDKADGTVGIEVTARIKPGSTDGVLSTAVPRRGYVFYASLGAKVSLEVTHGGTPQATDTRLVVYGPRLADGSYPVTLASDEDGGYGKLSKITDLQITIPGFYLVEVAFGAAATPTDVAKERLKLSCTGLCESPLPIQPMDEGLKWYRRSAERRALSLQSYGLARAKLAERLAAGGLPASWGVVMDIDETTLDNSAYQQARADLGVGYSPGSWTEWVNAKAATALPGVVSFTEAVHAAGGKVVLVSNRKAATECPATQDNLATVGVHFDGMLCKTDADDKNPRFQAIEAGTATNVMKQKTILYVGDNIQDFPMLTQDLRKQADSAFARFGEDFIVIPNSMYGSFDKNVD